MNVTLKLGRVYCLDKWKELAEMKQSFGKYKTESNGIQEKKERERQKDNKKQIVINRDEKNNEMKVN